jgi:hypothetical protein
MFFSKHSRTSALRRETDKIFRLLAVTIANPFDKPDRILPAVCWDANWLSMTMKRRSKQSIAKK